MESNSLSFYLLNTFQNVVKKVFQCHYCRLDLRGNQAYINHYKRVHKELPPEYADKPTVVCDKCGQVFLSDLRLKAHIAYSHKNKIHVTKSKMDKKVDFIKCSQCDKVFKHARNHQEHFKSVHEKDTPHQCQECPRKFALLSTLKVHLKVKHTKVKCDKCHEELYNNFYLKRHNAVVHGILPKGSFQCTQCPLFFKHQKNLEFHIANKH